VVQIQNYLKNLAFCILLTEGKEMDLKELGWDDFFQKQVDELDLEDILVGRVFRFESQDILGVLTKDGEVNARVPGRMRFKESELPAIGDWVIIEPKKLSNTILKALSRKKTISRKVTGT
jgi:translation initiation factor IF-1